MNIKIKTIKNINTNIIDFEKDRSLFPLIITPIFPMRSSGKKVAFHTFRAL